MTKKQFIEALLSKGYKVISQTEIHTRLIMRNNLVIIQQWETYTNVFYEKEIKDATVEYHQMRIADYAKALKNIEKFERKLKR